MHRVISKQKSDEISLVFDFFSYRLHIDHTYLTDFGEFSIFCMKAISEGFSLDDISEVTLLPVDFINEQISFARKIGYLNEDNKITDKGKYFLKILDFKEKFGNSLIFFVEPYIDDLSMKLIFSQEEVSAFKVENQIPVKGKIKRIKMLRNLNNLERYIIIDFLEEQLEDYRDLIINEQDNFVFSFSEEDKIQVKLNFTIEEFFNLISFDYIQGISIGIPSLCIESSISLSSENREIKDLFNSFISSIDMNRKFYNLINGDIIEPKLIKKQRDDDSIYFIDKKIDISEIAFGHGEIKIPIKLFPFLNIQSKSEECYAVTHIDESDLYYIFDEKIKQLGSKES